MDPYKQSITIANAIELTTSIIYSVLGDEITTKINDNTLNKQILGELVASELKQEIKNRLKK